MKLQNIRIGKRLLGGYALLIVILIILCVLAFRNMAQTDRRADEITNLILRRQHWPTRSSSTSIHHHGVLARPYTQRTRPTSRSLLRSGRSTPPH